MADRIVGLLEKEGLQDPHLIINRTRKHMIDSGDMLSVDDIVSTAFHRFTRCYFRR